MVMSSFVFTSGASKEAAVLSLFSGVKKDILHLALFFLFFSSDFPTAAMSVSPVHYSRITAFLFIWCEGVKQMQIGEPPEASGRLNPSPSSCQSQIIALTTKRHGQFRNRFREIGESNDRRHARFCAAKSLHEHIQRKVGVKIKKRACASDRLQKIFADVQKKTAGISGDGKNRFFFFRLSVVFGSLCCKSYTGLVNETKMLREHTGRTQQEVVRSCHSPGLCKSWKGSSLCCLWSLNTSLLRLHSTSGAINPPCPAHSRDWKHNKHARWSLLFTIL